MTVQSRGVCASPSKQPPLHGAYAIASLTEQFDWVDKTWDMVLEGQSSRPNRQQSNVFSQLKKRKRYSFLVRDCKVSHNICLSTNSSCGTLTFKPGNYSIQVQNWTDTPNAASRYGKLYHYPPVDAAYLFWDTNTSTNTRHAKFNQTRIYVHGIETMLTKKEATQVYSSSQGSSTSLRNLYHMKTKLLTAVPNRTRIYHISCLTDGIRASDLAMAISIYRSATLDAVAQSVQDWMWSPSLNLAPPLTSSDVAKAIYAFKSANHDERCQGSVAIYTSCGFFEKEYLLPFFCLVVAIILGWVVIFASLPRADARVPVDASSWRQQAQRGIWNTQDREARPAVNNLQKMHTGIFLMDSLADRASELKLQTIRSLDISHDVEIMHGSSSEETGASSSIRLRRLGAFNKSEDDEHTVHSWQLQRFRATPGLENADEDRLFSRESLRILSSDNAKS